jgi:hypothetical protein
MPLLEVTFIVEVERVQDFDSKFDEDRIEAALPGKAAWLVTIEEEPTITEALKTRWRRLRKS